jgi:murein DD-endopeptidase MepM/ murein hydrolase activator NlpD
VHTVKKGETVAAIAKKYKVDVEKIIAANAMGSASLSVGKTLIVPGGTPPVAAPVAPVRSLASVFTSSPVGAKAGATGTGRMLWPTDLHVITQKFGWKHTGLDIDCYFTNNNYAADDGTVQYAGWKKGYGYVVEINHGNGMVTRYGHHAKLYVTAGQPIARGTPIGLCGTTGKSSGTHLHFEVIIGGKFRNPLEYIR